MLRTFLRRAPLGARTLVCGWLLAAPLLIHPSQADAGQNSAKSNRGSSAALDELQRRLNAADLTSALGAIQRALSEVGDGSTYAWSRPKRRLKGVIKPTVTFRDAEGQLCRHLIYMLTLSKHEERIEGIACRQLDGAWSLSG